MTRRPARTWSLVPDGGRTPRALLSAALLLPALLAAACGSDPAADTINRETFIDAYVELRMAALDTDSQRVASADREAILDRLGITEDDLIEFVEVHGGDLELMREVWNEVEVRLDRTPEVVDTVG